MDVMLLKVPTVAHGSPSAPERGPKHEGPELQTFLARTSGTGPWWTLLFYLFYC
jgi:hypothetical protein